MRQPPLPLPDAVAKRSGAPSGRCVECSGAARPRRPKTKTSRPSRHAGAAAPAQINPARDPPPRAPPPAPKRLRARASRAHRPGSRNGAPRRAHRGMFQCPPCQDLPRAPRCWRPSGPAPAKHRGAAAHLLPPHPPPPAPPRVNRPPSRPAQLVLLPAPPAGAGAQPNGRAPPPAMLGTHSCRAAPVRAAAPSPFHTQHTATQHSHLRTARGAAPAAARYRTRIARRPRLCQSAAPHPLFHPPVPQCKASWRTICFWGGATAARGTRASRAGGVRGRGHQGRPRRARRVTRASGPERAPPFLPAASTPPRSATAPRVKRQARCKPIRALSRNPRRRRPQITAVGAPPAGPRPTHPRPRPRDGRQPRGAGPGGAAGARAARAAAAAGAAAAAASRLPGPPARLRWRPPPRRCPAPLPRTACHASPRQGHVRQVPGGPRGVRGPGAEGAQGARPRGGVGGPWEGEGLEGGPGLRATGAAADDHPRAPSDRAPSDRAPSDRAPRAPPPRPHPPPPPRARPTPRRRRRRPAPRALATPTTPAARRRRGWRASRRRPRPLTRGRDASAGRWAQGEGRACVVVGAGRAREGPARPPRIAALPIRAPTPAQEPRPAAAEEAARGDAPGERPRAARRA
jgi:hypothetical protein